MQNVVVSVFTVISFFVVVINWARIRKPDILFPSIAVALLGGITNSISTTYVQGLRPSLFTYIYVIAFSLLVTSSGLYLAAKSGLPGLWPQEQATVAETGSVRRRPGKAVLVGMGALLGVVAGLGLWQLALLAGPLPGDFLHILRNLRSGDANVYTALLIIQSGFIEEPMYRLFAISAVAEALKSAGITRTQRLVAGILVSSLAFGVIPTHNFLVSFVVGIIFGAAYLRLGLMPMIVAHCVGNAVQFPLLLGMVKR